MFKNYDSWKTATPEGYDGEACTRTCTGCPECKEECPPTLRTGEAPRSKR